MRFVAGLVPLLVVATCALPQATHVDGSGGTASGGAGGAGPCTHNADCADNGTPRICAPATGSCIELLSTECTAVYGAWDADGALLLGTILSVDQIQGAPMERAVRLAVDQLNLAGGLPDGDGGVRPLGLVACDDEGNTVTAQNAASHLVTVGATAVIGPSHNIVSMVDLANVTQAYDVLLISPAVTLDAVTGLADADDLVFRTAPPDAEQGSALAAYMPTVEADVRADLGLTPGDPITVMVVNWNGAADATLAALEAELTFNSLPATQQSGNYYVVQAYTPPVTQPVITAVLNVLPHVVIALGGAEVIDALVPGVEAGWQAPNPPRWLLLQGTFSGDMNALATNVPGVVPRLHGAMFGVFDDDFASFQTAFVTAFGAGMGPTFFGVPGAYDATYALAYASVAAGPGAPTGPRLAAGLRALVSGPNVKVGAPFIQAAKTQLAAGDIDLDGASGPLDFDATGEPRQRVGIWCVANPGGGPYGAIASGLYFDPETGGIAGALGPSCP